MRDKPMIQRSMRIGVDDIASVRIVCKKCQKAFIETPLSITESDTQFALQCPNPKCGVTFRGSNESGPVKHLVNAIRDIKGDARYEVEICFDVKD